ncbi:leucine-rich repeat-containing protein 27 isoform X1 [Lethenteron reissneri]|uniref:leucine-rich repeat-containing protein 27 isoform X1 n=2 Tax=Lethenteron reissneri TaxID=7753 RepID=UPI002AB7D480|nr:leucine-rich repeat-containing protein 27 isoform X1 [Lethenteron reissneri]
MASGDPGAEGAVGDPEAVGAPGAPGQAPAPRARDSRLSLDLSRRGLDSVPAAALRDASGLQHVCLEGNNLVEVPPALFECLPRMLWLDLRSNRLCGLPPAVGQHRSLKTLLLEGNPITHLPAELGRLTCLKSLSLRGCPLEEPPADIVHRGTRAILLFLRQVLAARALRANSHSCTESTVGNTELSCVEESPNEELHCQNSQQLQSETAAVAIPETDDRPLVSQLPHASRFTQGGGPHSSRDRKVASGVKSQPRSWAVDIARREQRSRAAEQAEQLRRNGEALRDWRTKAKQEQRQTQSERCGQGLEASVLDQVVRNAPFGTDPAYYPSVARAKPGSLGKAEPRAATHSGQELHGARLARERELQLRVRQHINAMLERRAQDKSTPRSTMQAAQREIQVAQQLQRELSGQGRRTPLDYRFTAFTGDPVRDHAARGPLRRTSSPATAHKAHLA